MINLYFGNPCDDWAKETVEIYAINFNVSMERALFMLVDNMVMVTSEKRDDGFSLIDDRIAMGYELFVYAPKIFVKQYSDNGSLYPMMTLSKDYVIHKSSGDRLPITEEVLTILGKDFEDSFGIEYLGHKWLDNQKILSAHQALLFDA
jgi:hypothetical protein